MLKKLEETQLKVGKWARANFGAQESEHIRITSTGGGGHLACLESLAPLIGMGEEIGEMATALREYDGEASDELADALGDVGVYLCDFAEREGINLADLGQYTLGLPIDDPGIGITEAYGKLCHAMLKRHQGIRGFDDYTTLTTYRNQAVAHMLAHLEAFGQLFGIPFVENLVDVFDEVVASRNWKAHPDDADVVAMGDGTAQGDPEEDSFLPEKKPTKGETKMEFKTEVDVELIQSMVVATAKVSVNGIDALHFANGRVCP